MSRELFSPIRFLASKADRQKTPQFTGWVQCPHCQSIIQKGYAICGGCERSVESAQDHEQADGRKAHKVSMTLFVLCTLFIALVIQFAKS